MEESINFKHKNIEYTVIIFFPKYIKCINEYHRYEEGCYGLLFFRGNEHIYNKEIYLKSMNKNEVLSFIKLYIIESFSKEILRPYNLISLVKGDLFDEIDEIIKPY